MRFRRLVFRVMYSLRVSSVHQVLEGLGMGLSFPRAVTPFNPDANTNMSKLRVSLDWSIRINYDTAV
jgi:hypothetical protein